MERVTKYLLRVVSATACVGVISLVLPSLASATPSLAFTAPSRIDNVAPYWSVPEFTAVSCVSASLCVAGDQWGDIVAMTNSSTGAWGPPAEVDVGDIVGVSCASASLCAAIDSAGYVVTSSDPAGGRSAWNGPLRIAPAGDGLSSVSCPHGASFCVATDTNGDLLVSTDPTGSDQWTVSSVVPSGYVLNDVSCSSPSLCVGIVYSDFSQYLVTSTDPTGGAGDWSSLIPLGGNSSQLGRISCFPGLCVAWTDEGLLMSTNPTGGAGAWSPPASDTAGGYGLETIACASADLCIGVNAGGNTAVTTDPTGGDWGSPANLGIQPVEALACAPDSTCAEVDASGDAITTTDPSAGSSAWTASQNVDGVNELTGISCPSSGLCVAVDTSGNVITTSDPQAGPWAGFHTADGDFAGVVCPAVDLCLASSGGELVTSTDPTGGIDDWTAASVPGGVDIGVPACVSTELCVAFGYLASDPADLYEAFSTDPGGGASTWSAVDLGYSWSDLASSSIACASVSLCLGIVPPDSLIQSTTPSAGIDSWTPSASLSAANGAPVYGITCPTTTLCAALDAGAVLTSTDPSAGASSWSVTGDLISPTDYVGGSLDSLTCAPETAFCAFDDDGGVWSSTDAAGGTGTWSTDENIESQPLAGLSCASSSLCVGIASGDNTESGDAMIGTAGGASDTLTINLAGSGTGSAGGSPVSCETPSTSCSASVAPGRLVSVTETPTGDGSFTGWSGACSGFGTCVVKMDGNETVTANFAAPPESTLSVMTQGSGSGTVTGAAYCPGGYDASCQISCPGACQATFWQNSLLILNAQAAAGSYFAGWGGTCSGYGQCTVPLSTAGETVTATFISNLPSTFPSGGNSPPSPPPVAGTVALSAVSAHVTSGHAEIAIDCVGGTMECGGTLTLTVPDKTLKAVRHKPARARSVVVARGSYALAAASKGEFSLTLTSAGKALIKQDHGRVTGTLTMTSSLGTSLVRPFTLIAAKPK